MERLTQQGVGFAAANWEQAFEDTEESATLYCRLCDEMRTAILLQHADVIVKSVTFEITGQPRERHVLPVAADLSRTSLSYAMGLLADLHDASITLVVHPSGYFPAMELVHGSDMLVRKDARLGWAAWLLRGKQYEIYSEGA